MGKFQKMTPLLKICFIFVLFSAVAVTKSEAGFRCFFGAWACSASCVALSGHTSGMCDDDGECFCSQTKISLPELSGLIPSRCHLGAGFCDDSCNAIGRMNGTCKDKDGMLDCVCSDERLSATELALCSAEAACRLSCQANGKASGECNGWNCQCTGN